MPVGDLDIRCARLIGPGGPFELQSLAAGGRAFKAGPSTLIELFAGLGRYGDRDCLIAGGDRLTYAAFLTQAKRGSLALAGLGVRPADRVGLAMTGGVEWVLAFAAIVLSGASVVVFPPGSESLGRAGAMGCSTVLADQGDWAALCRNAGELDSWRAPAAMPPEAEAMIAFTSGSTAVPKPVMIDHRGLLSGLRNMMLGGALASLRRPTSPISATPIRPTLPCVLLLAPLHHVAGYGQFLLMMMLGGRVVLPVDRAASALLDVAQRERTSSIVGVLPELVWDFGRAPARQWDLKSVSSITFYGARPPATLVARLREAVPMAEIGGGYGMTETNGSVAVASQHDLFVRPDTAGYVSPAAGLKIVSADGGEAAQGQEGDIWVSGPFLARGYLEAQSDGATRFTDGWLRTGDRGSVDADGFLFLAERDGDRIQLGGRDTPCRVLEQSAFAHRAVRDAAAFIGGGDSGRAGTLALVLEPGADRSALRRILSMELECEDLRLVEVQRIPRTESGKIDRRNLGASCDLVEFG